MCYGGHDCLLARAAFKDIFQQPMVGFFAAEQVAVGLTSPSRPYLALMTCRNAVQIRLKAVKRYFWASLIIFLAEAGTTSMRQPCRRKSAKPAAKCLDIPFVPPGTTFFPVLADNPTQSTLETSHPSIHKISSRDVLTSPSIYSRSRRNHPPKRARSFWP